MTKYYTQKNFAQKIIKEKQRQVQMKAIFKTATSTTTTKKKELYLSAETACKNEQKTMLNFRFYFVHSATRLRQIYAL